MTWFEKVMLHINWSVPSAWMVFSSLYPVSIKSYCRKTDGDLSWPEMTLAKWRGLTCRNISTQGVKYTCNPMFGSVLNGFLPKEAASIFLQLCYRGRWGNMGTLRKCTPIPKGMKKNVCEECWARLWCLADKVPVHLLDLISRRI